MASGDPASDAVVECKPTQTILAETPFGKFFNAQLGYVRCELTQQAWRPDYRVVRFVTRRGAPLHTAKSLVVEAGRVRLQDA